MNAMYTAIAGLCFGGLAFGQTTFLEQERGFQLSVSGGAERLAYVVGPAVAVRDTSLGQSLSGLAGPFDYFDSVLRGVHPFQNPTLSRDGRFLLARGFTEWPVDGVLPTYNLWLQHVDTREAEQLTDFPFGGDVLDPRISGDGRFAVFAAAVDPFGLNPDLSPEVFRIDLRSGDFQQISQSVGDGALTPDISFDGSRVVWADASNYDGTNDDGSPEIWRWQEGGAIQNLTRQSFTNARLLFPRLDDAGESLTFSGEAWFPELGGPIVLGWKVFAIDGATGEIKLATSVGRDLGFQSRVDAVISPDGSTVYHETDADLVGLNPDGSRELFAFEIGSGVTSQVTDTVGGLTFGSLTTTATEGAVAVADNGVVAYRSDVVVGFNQTTAPEDLAVFLSASRPACEPDVNQDGVLNGADFNAWLQAFDRGEVIADQNRDNLLTGADFNAWLTNFVAGCL